MHCVRGWAAAPLSSSARALAQTVQPPERGGRCLQAVLDKSAAPPNRGTQRADGRTSDLRRTVARAKARKGKGTQELLGRSEMLAGSDIRASSRSSTRMSVFDAGVRSTGQFEVMSKSQLSVRETMLLLLSMILNAMPAIIAGCLWAWYMGSVYNSVAGDVLDVLHEQPTGWAAEGFNYKNSGARLPPGPGPHVGTDVVYGSRQDLVDRYDLSSAWASQPSVSPARILLKSSESMRWSTVSDRCFGIVV